jgi:hypothetical protein
MLLTQSGQSDRVVILGVEISRLGDDPQFRGSILTGSHP